jgi:site-specific DNA recombinase
MFIRGRREEGWIAILRRYDDRGLTGETLDRPALNRLREDIAGGKVDRVVVHRLDRLSRTVRDFLELLQEFRSQGIGLSIITMPELSGSASDELVLNLISAFAEFEREIIGDRLADARRSLKRQGLRVAGAIPYGYSTNPHTKQLVIVPTEANHVRQMFELAADGKTPREIAVIANDNGWQTKRRRSRGSEIVLGGGLWTARQVLATLENRSYLREIRDGDQSRPGNHPAIVARDMFEQVRERIASRRSSKAARRKRTSAWPLQGLLWCGQCNRLMIPATSPHRNLRYRYYRCRSNAGGRPPCQGVSMPAHEIEQFVVEQLANVATRKPVTRFGPKRREAFRAFGEYWSGLDFSSQCRHLRCVVDRVTFEPARATIQVSFNELEMTRLKESHSRIGE